MMPKAVDCAIADSASLISARVSALSRTMSMRSVMATSATFRLPVSSIGTDRSLPGPAGVDGPRPLRWARDRPAERRERLEAIGHFSYALGIETPPPGQPASSLLGDTVGVAA